MKKLLSIVSILLLTISLNAQEVCGFDHLLDKVLSDSITSAEFDSVRTAIRNQIVKNNGEAKDINQPNTYTIPVVFHVIGDGTAAALTDAQIIAQLQVLNEGFSNSLGSTYGVADDAQITFCLAQKMPGGTPFNGITRTSTPAAITVSNNHQMDALGANSQQALTNVIYFNQSRYLNIWIVNSISLPNSNTNTVLGYSPFPLMSGLPNQFLDGVVMRSDVVGLNSGNPRYNQGRILIHEVGHYLGLFHTFEPIGCNEVINGIPCNLGGDECCDTPPVANFNQNDCILLGSPNSCFESPDLNDMIENHMDYAYDNVFTCRNTFTEDQSDRMHATIQVFRSMLVSFQNLLITGLQCLPSGLDPTSTTTDGNTQFCTGNPYGFLSASGANTYSWTFPDATPSTSSIFNPTGISWSVPGTYNVLLTVTDISGASLSSTLQVFVSNCTPVTGANANWYFGRFAAISFTSGIPTSISPSSINTIEASAAVSDNTGLIFYTDGRRIFNPSHIAIPGVMNGGPHSISGSGENSTSKGVVIVPRPGTANYYILPNTDIDPSLTSNICNGVSLYEYNTLTNSLVSPTPIHPIENYATTEPIIAVPHCNGQDYWVVVKPVNNNQPGLQNEGLITNVNTQIASYLITNTGLSPNPVLSSSGPFIPLAVRTAGNHWGGQTVISPNKKLIAFTDGGSNNCYVYYFNSGNGICQYITTLPSNGYGVSFSPNSTILYVTQASGNNGNIRQYDISSLSICNPNPPFIEFNYMPIGVNPLFPFYSMQLGPDNKIYVARVGNTFNPQRTIAAINFPDVINSSSTSNECGYNFNAVPLLFTQSSKGDLPNDIIGFIGANPTDFSFCVTGCAQTCFTNLGCGTNFTWNFGDGNTITGVNGDIPAGTNGGTTSGNFEYPCHTYAGPGNYTVTYSIDGGTPVSHVVNITLPPVPTITGPNPVCTTSALPEFYSAPLGYQYSWTATNASPTTGNLPTFNVSWTSFPATLTLVITDPATGCTNSNSITITQTSTLPIVNAGTDVNVCPPGSVQLNGAVSNGTIIGWSPSTDLSCVTCLNPSASPSTTTTYTLSAFNGCGTSTDQVTVDATCITNPECNLLSTTTLPIGATSTAFPSLSGVVDVLGLFTIDNSVTYTNVKFRMSAGAQIDIQSGKSLTLDGCHVFSCTQLWKEITVNPNANLYVNNYSIIEDAEQAVHWINGGNVTLNSSIFNRNGAGLHLQGANTAPNVVVSNTIFTCRNFPNSLYSTSFNAGSFTTLKNELFNDNLSLYPYGSLIAPAPANTRSLYGVISSGVDVTIGISGIAKNRNLFDYLDFGIHISSNAEFTVVNNSFSNLSGYNISSTIKGIGVYAVAKSADMATIGGNNTKDGNYFKNCYRGANLIGYNTINFINNSITNTLTSPNFTTPVPHIGHYGLAIFNSGGGGIGTSVNYVIRNNSIDNNETGIYINGVYSLIQNNFVQITNNQMDVTGTGTYSNRGVWIQNMVGSQAVNGDVFVYANTIENCDINAMLFENLNNMLRVDGNAPSVTPTPTLQTKEVVRLNSCTNASLVNNTISTTNNTTIPSGTTTNFITGIFVNKCQSSLVSCNTILYVDVCVAFIQSNSMSQFTANDMNFAQYGLVLANGGIIGQQGDATHPSGNRWGRNDANNITLNHTYIYLTSNANTASQLYCKANTGSTNCSSGSLFKTFPCSNGFAIAGEEYQLAPLGGLFTASGPSPGCNLKPGNPKANALALLQEATNGNGSNVDKFLHKSQAFHLIKTDQTGVLLADPTLNTFYQQEQVQNIGKLSTTNELVVANDYVTAKNTVNSLAPTNIAESNFKIAYDVWLDLLLDSNYVLNTSDSMQLVTVANMCIQEGGDATIMARTLLANFTQNAVNYVDCFELPFGDTANRISETSSFDEKKIESFGFSQEVKINLYPNPNNGSFRVTHNLPLENNVYIEVMDITGKIVHHEMLTTGSQQVVKTKQMNTGLYFVNFISDSGELIYSTKMSITHE